MSRKTILMTQKNTTKTKNKKMATERLLFLYGGENSLNVLIKISEYKINTENLADGLALMKDIKDGSITTALFDPQRQKTEKRC